MPVFVKVIEHFSDSVIIEYIHYDVVSYIFANDSIFQSPDWRRDSLQLVIQISSRGEESSNCHQPNGHRWRHQETQDGGQRRDIGCEEDTPGAVWSSVQTYKAGANQG